MSKIQTWEEFEAFIKNERAEFDKAFGSISENNPKASFYERCMMTVKITGRQN